MSKSKRLALGLASFALVESAALEEYAAGSNKNGGHEGFSLLWGKSKGGTRTSGPPFLHCGTPCFRAHESNYGLLK